MGYVAIRISRHLRVPVVTTFLLLGVVAGPGGLNLVGESVVDSLRIVEPVALGMITFAAGEQLFLRDIRALSQRSYVVVALETVLPVLLVGVGAWLLTGKLEVALPIGAIAGTTGVATVISTLRESGAKGNYAKLLGFSIASDNFFAILAFSLLLPLAVGLETGEAIGHLYAYRMLGMLASVAMGCVAGSLVAYLVQKVRSSHELLMLVLAHVLLVVGVTEYLNSINDSLGFSILLAGLAMGTTAANLTREERNRDRAFAALLSLEYPVIAIFFLWAGAGLHIRALAGAGVLFAVYVGARLVGKLAGPLVTALITHREKEESRRFVGLGMSLLPQAGAAVGLGILARDMLPGEGGTGETILAAVLAAVVVFELVGPLGVHWAARHVGEAKAAAEDEPLTLSEAISELQSRRPRIAVLMGKKADPVLLDTPRRLAVRLCADLLVVPVTDEPAGKVEPTEENLHVVEDPDKLCSLNESSLGGCRQILVEPVSVRGRAADGLVAVLDDFGPALVLLAPRGLPSFVTQVSGEIARRLGCPVLKAPLVEMERRGRLWRARQLFRALGDSGTVERSRSLWRRSAEGWTTTEAAYEAQNGEEAPVDEEASGEEEPY